MARTPRKRVSRARAVRSQGLLALACERLPFSVRLGPYHFNVVRAARCAMTTPNLLSEFDANGQEIRLHSGLEGKKRVRHFLYQLVRAVHYTSGMDDNAKEEHFTHCTATGLMAFAVSNSKAWQWLNAEIQAHICPDIPLGRYAAGIAPAMPLGFTPQVKVGRASYTFKRMSRRVAERLCVWGLTERGGGVRQVQLSEELLGTHALVIFLHELFHTLHWENKLGDRSTEHEFRAGETDALLRFIRDNPQAWAWFVVHVTRMQPRRRQARAALRAAA